MSLFLYLFFIPNKRSVGITHTKYYRTDIIMGENEFGVDDG